MECLESELSDTASESDTYIHESDPESNEVLIDPVELIDYCTIDAPDFQNPTQILVVGSTGCGKSRIISKTIIPILKLQFGIIGKDRVLVSNSLKKDDDLVNFGNDVIKLRELPRFHENDLKYIHTWMMRDTDPKILVLDDIPSGFNSASEVISGTVARVQKCTVIYVSHTFDFLKKLQFANNIDCILFDPNVSTCTTPLLRELFFANLPNSKIQILKQMIRMRIKYYREVAETDDEEHNFMPLVFKKYNFDSGVKKIVLVDNFGNFFPVVDSEDDIKKDNTKLYSRQ